MNRLLLIGAAALASVVIATPAALGLIGNTSFSRDLRVPVPSGAHQVQPSDLSSPADATSSPIDDRTSGPDPSEVEDHPGHDVAPSGTTDDHGGLRTAGDNSGPGRGSGGSDDERRGDDRSGRSGRSGGRDG